jgi:hypothetical protein
MFLSTSTGSHEWGFSQMNPSKREPEDIFVSIHNKWWYIMNGSSLHTITRACYSSLIRCMINSPPPQWHQYAAYTGFSKLWNCVTRNCFRRVREPVRESEKELIHLHNNETDVGPIKARSCSVESPAEWQRELSTVILSQQELAVTNRHQETRRTVLQCTREHLYPDN